MDIIAAIFGVLGSIVLSIGSPKYIPHGFVCHIIGSIGWGIFGLQLEVYSLVISSVMFLVIEIVGLHRWIRYNRRKYAD